MEEHVKNPNFQVTPRVQNRYPRIVTTGDRLRHIRSRFLRRQGVGVVDRLRNLRARMLKILFVRYKDDMIVIAIRGYNAEVLKALQQIIFHPYIIRVMDRRASLEDINQ